MKRKIILLLLVCFLLAGIKSAVFAADLDIDCSGAAECAKSGVDPLFNTAADGFWYPGKTLTKVVNLKNSSSGKKEMAIKGEEALPTGVYFLKDKMNISIVGGGNVIWASPLPDFYIQDKISMGIFDSGADLDYDFTVFMDIDAGDDYQNKETVFDLTLGFWGELILTPTPTSTGTPAPTPTAGAVLGVGVSAPGCADTLPGGAPVLLSAIPGVNSVVLTWSEAPDPVSYYLVAYGTASGVYDFGNPNVGGKGTTSYTVFGLSGGTEYFFVVRAGNGCATGPFSNEISAIPAGVFVAPGPAPGFEEGVLGEATQPGQLGGGTATEASSVKGAKKEKICRWWLVFSLIALLFNSGYVYYYREKFKEEKLHWLAPAAISILAYFGDKFMHRWWPPSRFCSVMWLFSLLSFVLPLFVWRCLWKKQEN